MKKYFLLLFLFFFISSTYSQTIKRQVICSYGGSSTISNNYISTTFGQSSSIDLISDSSYFILQGFEQKVFNLTISGCTDPLAINYDSLATVDDSSCTYCYANADIIPDTIYACDSVEICIDTIVGGAYSWLTSNVSNHSPSI